MQERFTGCLVGGLLGDAIGAPVEAESAAYISKTFASVDDILKLERVEELLGAYWTVGRYTDDTQMTVCVAQWLLEDGPEDGRKLLARFAEAFRPARRYGSSTAGILQAFEEHQDEWRSLATLMFPAGSYGNGSAMRVGPIGCLYYLDPSALFKACRVSSRTTHSHPLAIQGATLQASAIAALIRSDKLDVNRFLGSLELVLKRLAREGPEPLEYRRALDTIAEGLSAGHEPARLAESLGTGLEAKESVPMALYCFLFSPNSFEQVVHHSVFLGGDTDTIASMAACLSGAYLGEKALPKRWCARMVDEDITPGSLAGLARQLAQKCQA
ncbi:ADP-ribosylglycohydrolase family protein [bacterium]|nr:ADP-ribosylglycohydrolase family protein [bacterium]